MQQNVARKITAKTAEGGNAFPHMKPMQALRRSVLACLLWEDEFYEDGKTIAERITQLSAMVSAKDLAALAIEARSTHNLRHVPLLLLCALAANARGNGIVAETIGQTIQRADELSEFLTLYWRDGKTPIAKQVKKGLAAAFGKFSAYDLAKYDRAKAIRLRDVLFMVHAKPKDEAQAAIWKQLVDGTLPAPDTWEVALSSGADKRESWERLRREGTLGYLALLRNLRNMTEVGVDTGLIRAAIVARKGAHRVLPFRYVAAARACPQLEPAIDEALSEAISTMPVMPGKTVVLVDVSRSMDDALSAKSDMRRIDAATALASLINGDIRMFSFSDKVVEVPPRRGMAGVDALIKSQTHNGTALFDAVAKINRDVPYDRLIVITDEQANAPGLHGYRVQGDLRSLPDPVAGKIGYMVNVASNKNGVGYGAWRHVDGFSEGILRWIVEAERDAEEAR